MKDGNSNNKPWSTNRLAKIGGGLGLFSFIALAVGMADDVTSLIERFTSWGNSVFTQNDVHQPLTPASPNNTSPVIVEDRVPDQPSATPIQRSPQTAGNSPQHQEVQNAALAKLGATAEILTELPQYTLSEVNVGDLIDGRTSPVFSVPVVTENLVLRITLPVSTNWVVSSINLRMPKNTDTREMPRNIAIGESLYARNDCTYFQNAELKRGTKNNRISFPERLIQQICIDIKTNWGSPRISMSEIEIVATPVPANR